ncbi:PfkB family carbohydrate kinase [Rhodococcus antarcticus]|uniref:PfkB family carbohydrate kinase n=1 Tax=Rhodococcus antarcticus TaxID=2987751 RepID=A0ABY6P2L7_9NOCA|nr:PfkB family carbohydrate kinase [Rhodococcus antarcticus]UZJ25890.1 PfkB family carbohydrate kinase [Rhodococcus antarcticus]
MSPAGCDVLVLGDVVLDVVVHTGGRVLRGTDTDAEIALLPGGAGANVAAGLAREGLSVTMVGCVGDDGAETATRALRAQGVKLALRTVPGAATGTVVVLVEADGDRSMACDRGANLALHADDVPDELLLAHRHLHVSGYALFGPPRDATLDVLARARALGLTVSLDPASVAPLRAYGPTQFRTDTAGVDLLLPNAEEALALTGEPTPARAATALAREHTAVAVTCGADGALWARGGQVTSRSAHGVVVVDTVGAGDAFTAGAVAGLLAGSDGPGCLERGLAAAARCVGGVGAQA